MKEKTEIKNFLEHVDLEHHGEYIETCKECRKLVQELRYKSADKNVLKEVENSPYDNFTDEPQKSNYSERLKIAKSKLYHIPNIDNITVAKDSKVPLRDVQEARERLMVLGLIPIEIINSHENYIEQLKYALELINKQCDAKHVKELSGLQDYEYQQLNDNKLDIDETFKQTRIYYDDLINSTSLEFLVFLRHFFNVDHTYFLDDNKYITLKKLISKKLLSHVINQEGNICIPKTKITKNDGFWKLQILLIRYAEISNQSVSYLFTQPTINEYNHLYKEGLQSLDYDRFFNLMYDTVYNEWCKRKKNGEQKYNYTYKKFTNVKNFMYRDNNFKKFNFVFKKNNDDFEIKILPKTVNTHFKSKYYKTSLRKHRLKHGD